MSKVKSQERYKTLKDVFDDFTEKTIFKLISQGIIEGLESPISVGKESNVFSAKTKDREKRIAKIYRLQTCDFNRMYDYIKCDPRFTGLEKKRRKIIFFWAQREYKNLLLFRKIGVRVPIPITVLNNVLIMEFIGNEAAALKLKDKTPLNPEEFFDELIKILKKMRKAGVVHTDLSAFNILNYQERPVLIDLSQATTKDNPNYEEYWKRDIHNVVKYFQKTGLKVDEDEVMKIIS